MSSVNIPTSGPMGGPRILVVAEFAPGAAGGDWVNIKQHFRGLDWSQIYWWSFIGKLEASPRDFGGRHSAFNAPSRLMPNQRLRGLKGWLVENFVMPAAYRHLLAYIREVKPDLVFLMARGWMIPLAYHVMPKTTAHWHMALYDMPDVDGMVQRLGRDRTDRFTKMANSIYRNAANRSIISPAMGTEMERLTGVACADYFRCAIEPEVIARLSEPAPAPPEDVIRIGYAGVIIAEPTFVRLVRALQLIRGKLTRRVEIHLYGMQRYADREWFDPELIIEHGFISDAELDRHYRSGTWGLAIMHVDEIDPRYNHYSFPCKFTMALSSGLPLICIGHRDTPLIQLAKDYRLGLMLDESGVDSLAESLLAGLEDFSKFPAYRAEVRRCAEKEFNAEIKRRRIHEWLKEAQTRQL
jgi:glycosyltransferase involved in cell wall biosynthesis